MIKNTFFSFFSALIFLTLSLELTYANQQEEQLIQQNKTAAKSSTNQAMFVVHRIKCLKSNDRAALIACNKALSINPNAAPLRQRKILLTNRLNPKPKRQPVRRVTNAPVNTPKKRVTNRTNNPANKIVRKQSVPKRTPVANTPVRKVVKANEKKQQRKTAQNNNKKLVIQIQNSLNTLGFEVGKADGVAGKKTKKAVLDFLKISASKISPNLDKKLLQALDTAEKQHVKANDNFQKAEQQLKEGNLEISSQIINKYLKIAPWHKDLISLENTLKQKLAIQEENEKKRIKAENLAKTTAEKNLSLKRQFEEQQQEKQKETKALIVLAQTQFDDKELENADLTINKGLALSPDNKDLLSLKSDIQIIKKKQERIIQIQSESQQMFLNGNLSNTMVLIEEGLTLNPTDTNLLALKSKVELKLEEIQTQKEKEETLSILYARALNELNKNEFDSAMAFIKKGLSLDDKYTKLLKLETKVLTKQTELIAQKEKEFQLNSLLNKTKTGMNANEFDVAMEHLSKGLSLDPDNIELLNLKTEIVTKKEELEAKRQTNEKIANLFKQASDDLSTNDLDGALGFVNQGLKLDSKNLDFIEIKKEIISKQQNIAKQEKINNKVTLILSLIEEKQTLLTSLDNTMITEKQMLLNQAQQTLKNALSQ